MDSADRPPPKRYLTNQEAAEFLKLSPRTLNKQRVHGGGPQFHKFGRRVVYALSDLEAWANARVCGATFDPAYQVLQTRSPRRRK
jgi:predicted DNA-binding transcriptional regulator AlpA